MAVTMAQAVEDPKRESNYVNDYTLFGYIELGEHYTVPCNKNIVLMNF